MPVQRGDIYLLQLDKERAVLVVQNDLLNHRLQTTIIVSLTSQEQRTVYENTQMLTRDETELGYDSVLIGHEVYLVARSKLIKKS